MPKTIMYIDGQNFMHRVEEKLSATGLISNEEKLTKLDIKYISDALFPSENIEIRYYGVAKVKRETAYGDEVLEKSIKVADNTRRLRNFLSQNGVIYRVTGRLKIREDDICKNCGVSRYRYTEKGVDVGLASEMVCDAATGQVDRVILASSDLDLAPAARIVKRFAELTYLGFEDRLIDEFVGLSSETKIITNELLGLAYAEAITKNR